METTRDLDEPRGSRKRTVHSRVNAYPVAATEVGYLNWFVAGAVDLCHSPANRGEPNSLRTAEVGRGWRRCPRGDLRQALKSHGVVGEEAIVMMPPDKKRELEYFRWMRDHAEEAAASLRPGDIRTPEKLRHGAQQMIDLIEKGQIPGQRR